MSKYIGAVGIEVKNLEKSAEFYRKALGMVKLRSINLPEMNELIIGFPESRSAALILMQYLDQNITRGSVSLGKLVYFVDDTAKTIETIREEGGLIEREAGMHESMGLSIIGLARDLDGHLLEFIQKPPKA